MTIALLTPVSLQSQRLTPVPSYAVSSVASPPGAFQLDSTRAIPRTYWLEGGVIGGLGLGVFTAMLVNGFSEGETNVSGNVMAFLFGASVGFPVGALIGGQFPKNDQ